jgi:hypothetical protein
MSEEERIQNRGMIRELRGKEREFRAAGATAARWGSGNAAAKWLGIDTDRATKQDLLRAKTPDEQLAILTQSMGMSPGDAGFEDHKKRMKDSLLLLQGIDPSDSTGKTKVKSKEAAAATARQDLLSLRSEVEKDRKEKSEKDSPSYKVLEDIKIELTKISGDSKLTAANTEGTKNGLQNFATSLERVLPKAAGGK